MKWEFTVAELANSLSSESLESRLDIYGYNEWDLVNIINCGDKSKFIFKRELKLEECMIIKLI